MGLCCEGDVQVKKFRVRAQRVEYADVIVMLPDDAPETYESVAALMHAGEHFKLNVSLHTVWLPTQMEQLPDDLRVAE